MTCANNLINNPMQWSNAAKTISKIIIQWYLSQEILNAQFNIEKSKNTTYNQHQSIIDQK